MHTRTTYGDHSRSGIHMHPTHVAQHDTDLPSHAGIVLRATHMLSLQHIC